MKKSVILALAMFFLFASQSYIQAEDNQSKTPKLCPVPSGFMIIPDATEISCHESKECQVAKNKSGKDHRKISGKSKAKINPPHPSPMIKGITSE